MNDEFNVFPLSFATRFFIGSKKYSGIDWPIIYKDYKIKEIDFSKGDARVEYFNKYSSLILSADFKLEPSLSINEKLSNWKHPNSSWDIDKQEWISDNAEVLSEYKASIISRNDTIICCLKRKEENQQKFRGLIFTKLGKYADFSVSFECELNKKNLFDEIIKDYTKYMVASNE